MQIVGIVCLQISLLFADKSVLTVVALTNYEWFKGWENEQVKKRGDLYEQFKLDIQNRIWEQLLAYLPQLEDKV